MSEEPEVYAEDLADSVPLPSGMPHRTMPERIYAANVRGLRGHAEEYGFDGATEYIRADVVQAQLDVERKRIAELEGEYKLHRESSLADFLKQSDEHKAEIERLKSRVIFDCRQLLAERDARIAELEAAQAWVSVDERLPSEEDKGAIVWTNNGSDYESFNYDIGFYHEKNGWLLSTEWEYGDPTVTHWMPLPPPPVTP